MSGDSNTRWTIEHAKSGRASCKKCKSKIGKGDLRVGTHVMKEDEGYEMSSWRCLPCFPLPRKFKVKGQNVEEAVIDFVNEKLQDETDGHIMSDDKELKHIIAEIAAASDIKPAAAKRKKAGGDANDEGAGDGGKKSTALPALDQVRADLLALVDAGELGPPKKKVKVVEGTSVTNINDIDHKRRAMAEALETYSAMTIAELKDILEWNKQMKTGTKDILTYRCVDGHVNGRLSLCPMCKKGRLQLDLDSGCKKVECKGYYDEERAARISCGYKMPVHQVDRFQPWFTEKPTEEEEDAMDAFIDPMKDMKVKFISRAEALSLEFSSTDSIRASAQALVDLCQDMNVNIPEESNIARREVGKIIMTHRDETIEEIATAICDHFGLKETEEEKAERQDLVASICAVPGNGPVYEAMAELSDLYYKEGNSNAGTAYKKVANAVKDLTIEITVDNAKGLGKNKTKVPGIGKGSAEKMYELLATGSIEKLEEKRAANR